MSHPSALWTDDRVDMLRRMWAAGASAAQIAVALDCGLSRSAVIGKAARLKLERRVSVVHRAGRPKVAPPELTRSVRKIETKVGVVLSDARPPKEPAARSILQTMSPLPTSSPVEQPPAGKPVKLAQLDAAFRKCRWIVHRDPARVGRDLYCGAPTVPGRSWCGHHNDLVCDRSSLRRSERSAVHARAAE